MAKTSAKDWVREGLRHVETNDYAAARDCFTRAVEQEPRYPRALFCLGAACYQLGDMDQALRHWDVVHALDPDYGNVEKWIDAATQQAALADFARDEPDTNGA